MASRIYLDNNATTALDKKILPLISPLYTEPLNPSSVHSFGRHAKSLLCSAREKVASYLKVKEHQIIFTSGGTESLSFLIHGLFPKKGTILSTNVEHSCIHSTLDHLKKHGYNVSYVPVGREGAPTIDAIESMMTKEISLMVFSAVYSETGAKIDLEKIAALARRHGAPLIIDGVALLGKENFTIPSGISGMGFSSHKLHGPRGVGLTYLSPEYKWEPLLRGGHQEFGLRAGTENLEGIIGFSEAISLLNLALPDATNHMKHLRDYFETSLIEKIADVQVNGGPDRICNTSNLYFDKVDGETLLLMLDRNGVCASMGSACSSGAIEPSRVLLNMGLSRKEAKSSLRFSFCRNNTIEEAKRAAQIVIDIAAKLKAL
jgi:cysteine desulfurase